ncbi:transposase, partial [Colletotrichum incanum]
YPFFNTAIPHKRHPTKGSCICWPAAVIPYPGEASSRLGSSRSLAIIGHSFQHLAIPEVQAIKLANRYNIDKTRILKGKGSNGLVLRLSKLYYINNIYLLFLPPYISHVL